VLSESDGTTTLEHTVIRRASVRPHAVLGIARMSRFPGEQWVRAMGRETR
jgi:hypothetical protein